MLLLTEGLTDGKTLAIVVLPPFLCSILSQGDLDDEVCPTLPKEWPNIGNPSLPSNPPNWQTHHQNTKAPEESPSRLH